MIFFYFTEDDKNWYSDQKTTTTKTRLLVADSALIALELPLLHFSDLAGHLLNPQTYNKQIKMMESIEHS